MCSPAAAPRRITRLTPLLSHLGPASDAATLALEQVPITTLNVILLAALREPALIMDELPEAFPATKAHSYWFPRLPARDIIWGYTDTVLGQHFPGMQQNDTSFAYAMAQHSRHRIATGKFDPGRGMEYLEWNGNSELLCCAVGPAGEANAGTPCAPIWNGYDASGFRGSFGTAFHTFIDPGETLQIATYPFGIYRHWPLVCGNVGGGPGAGVLSDGTALTAAIGGCDSYTVQGVHLLRFALPAWVMGNASIDAVEAAAYNISGPSGVLNVTACEQNAPILLSRPHFLSASPALAAAVTGLAPADPALHDSWLGIEPLTGQTIDFQFRVQINAVVQPVTARPFLAAPFTFFEGLAGPIVFPIGWGEQQSSATPFQGNLVTGMIYTPLRAAAALHWGGIVIAAAALAVGFVFAARAAGYCGGARVSLGGSSDELELGKRGGRGAALLDSADEAEDFYRGFKSGE